MTYAWRHQEKTEERRMKTALQNEVAYLRRALQIIAAPVSVEISCDPTGKEMGREFGRRLTVATNALGGLPLLPGEILSGLSTPQ